MLNDIKWHKIHGLSETVDDGAEPPKLHDVGKRGINSPHGSKRR